MKHVLFQKFGKSLLRIVFLLTVILGGAALCYLLWDPGSDTPLPDYSGNAIWIGHGWIGDDVWYAHGIHFNNEELKTLADTSTGIAHCPASNMKLASGIARIPEMLKLGVPLSIAVDGSASNDGSDMLQETRLGDLLGRVKYGDDAPTAYDYLKMAASGGAKVLGREDIGSIEVGKCADLFMVDSRRLDIVGAAYSPENLPAAVGLSGAVDYTIVNGRVTVENGRLTAEDEEKLAFDSERKIKEYLGI